MNNMQAVLAAYGLDETTTTAKSFGSGLINRTWKLYAGEKQFILQKINHLIFKEPEKIAHNIELIASYLQVHHPDYCFVAPIYPKEGKGMIYVKDEGFFRMFPFLPDSHAKDVVQTPEQAYEAAAQFGTFTRLLSRFDVKQLQTTIPHFHDLTLRYQQFLTALKNGNRKRIVESDELIKCLCNHADIVTQFKTLQQNPAFKLRVTHHDTKISNVLFDVNDKGICVIDLDTVMPGYFISDVGDMMRTYLSPVNEEEGDVEKIEVRDDFYKAIVQGFYHQMKDELTQVEKDHFFYAGKFMIYMQALRFLTDHFNDDVYYGAKYEGQNFVRANNQAVLLQRLIEKEDVLR